MTVLNDLIGYIKDGGVPVFHTKSLVLYWLIGLVAGVVAWFDREAKYKKVLRNRHQSLA
jgi:hypothetical protein